MYLWLMLESENIQCGQRVDSGPIWSFVEEWLLLLYQFYAFQLPNDALSSQARRGVVVTITARPVSAALQRCTLAHRSLTQSLAPKTEAKVPLSALVTTNVALHIPSGHSYKDWKSPLPKAGLYARVSGKDRLPVRDATVHSTGRRQNSLDRPLCTPFSTKTIRTHKKDPSCIDRQA